MARIGILGGGQLGLMVAEALDRLGQRVRVLEPDPLAPCARRRADVQRGRFDDPAALAAFFAEVEVATFDSENLPAAPLAPYASALRPSLSVLEVTQHRGAEKTFLRDHGFRPVRFEVVPADDDLPARARAFGLPCIVKSALGGYDGKGQFNVSTEADLLQLPRSLAGGCIIEERVELETELSCLVARDGTRTISFPIFENLHAHSILDFTVVPARVPPSLEDEARRLAVGIADALQVVGLLTVELFVARTASGQRTVYVNELAPRVHNSGHVTRQACTLSQFDALARVLAQVPLVQPALHRGGWCMGQLLGDVWLAQGRTGEELDLSAWQAFPDVVDVYLYGKREARPGRKMGHFVVHADTAERALERAQAFRRALTADPQGLLSRP